jgi:hypothetical protein
MRMPRIFIFFFLDGHLAAAKIFLVRICGVFAITVVIPARWIVLFVANIIGASNLNQESRTPEQSYRRQRKLHDKRVKLVFVLCAVQLRD